MQAVLCDICERRVVGDAYELHLIRGQPVDTTNGTRLSRRRGSSQVYLCGICGGWLKQAIEYLRGGFQVNHAAEELLPSSLRDTVI